MALLFFQWLYFDAPRAYLGYAREVTLALYNYFSIPFLLATLFDPWRQDAIDISRLPIRYWSQALLSNFFSRLIGAVVRLSVIVFGLIAISTFTLGTAIFFAGWHLLPFLLVGSFAFGVQLLAGGFRG